MKRKSFFLVIALVLSVYAYALPGLSTAQSLQHRSAHKLASAENPETLMMLYENAWVIDQSRCAALTMEYAGSEVKLRGFFGNNRFAPTVNIADKNSCTMTLGELLYTDDTKDYILACLRGDEVLTSGTIVLDGTWPLIASQYKEQIAVASRDKSSGKLHWVTLSTLFFTNIPNAVCRYEQDGSDVEVPMFVNRYDESILSCTPLLPNGCGIPFEMEFTDESTLKIDNQPAYWEGAIDGTATTGIYTYVSCNADRTQYENVLHATLSEDGKTITFESSWMAVAAVPSYYFGPMTPATITVDESLRPDEPVYPTEYVAVSPEESDCPVSMIYANCILKTASNTWLGIKIQYGTSYICSIYTDQESLTIPDSYCYPEEYGDELLNIMVLGVSSNLYPEYVPNLTTINCGTYLTQNFFSYNNTKVSDIYFSQSSTSINNNVNRTDGKTTYVHLPMGCEYHAEAFGEGFCYMRGDEVKDLPAMSKSAYRVRLDDGTVLGVNEKDGTLIVTEIYSQNASIAIPAQLPYGTNSNMLPVTQIGYGSSSSYSSALFAQAPGVRSIAIPASVTQLHIRYLYNECQFTEMHMAGSAPSTYWTVPSGMSVYVERETDYGSYKTSWTEASIIPDGWEFGWITVNVPRPGEFAETYLTENNYDWSIAINVRVNGDINDTDMAAMQNFPNLMKLDLSGTTITAIPDLFMANSYTLEEMTLPSTLVGIGYGAFYSCSSLKTLHLNGITSIGESAFNGCSSLTDINTSGVKTIGNNAFYNCQSLSSIDLSSAEMIGDYAFNDCCSLASVDLPSVKELGQSAFNNCIKLASATLSNAIATINPNAFAYTALSAMTLHEGVKEIGSNAFYNCKSLTTIELPFTLTTIDFEAFYGCESLSSVSTKTGLTTIGARAFYYCRALQEISIPSTVKSIGDAAFCCTGITAFRCHATIPPSANSAFIGYDMDMTRTYLYVPPFSKDIYRNTQYWSDFFLMRSIDEPIDYIYVDRPITINLEEEGNDVLANNPTIELTYGDYDYLTYTRNLGQLTALGNGTLSAGQFTVTATLANRTLLESQLCPTLLNYADKMRADNVSHRLYFSSSPWDDISWHFISLPYDVNVSDIVASDGTYWVIRRYDSAARATGDTSSTWVNLTNGDVMEAGKGYIVAAVGGESIIDQWGNPVIADPCLTFTSGNSLTKNNLFRSSDIIVPLTEYEAEYAHNRSWNLIGNPYPCYFDMHYLKDDFTAPITIWDGESYAAYSPVDDDLVLSPYEAFFVQRPLNAAEMIFGECGRMHSVEDTDAYKAPQQNGSDVAVEGRNVFNFVITGDNYEDRTRIVLNPDAKADYEIGRDASKFFAPTSDNAQIYVAADAMYSICERPIGDGFAKIGIRSSSEKAYSIALSGKHSSEWNVLLTDNVTGTTVNLAKEEYEFTTSDTDSPARFTVQFTIGNNEESGIDAIMAEFGTNALVTVTAINGVVTYSGKLCDMKVPNAGLYIISDGNTVRKAILK